MRAALSLATEPELPKYTRSSEPGASDATFSEKPRRRRMGEVVEGRVVIEPGELLRHGVDDLPAAVPDIDAPQPADAVEHPVAVAVVDVGAVGLGDHRARALPPEPVEVGEGMDEMFVERENLVGRILADVTFHGVASPRLSRSGAKHTRSRRDGNAGGGVEGRVSGASGRRRRGPRRRTAPSRRVSRLSRARTQTSRKNARSCLKGLSRSIRASSSRA